MAERGVLTKDTHETVIRFAPPLTISREQLDWGIDVFAAVLAEVRVVAAFGSARVVHPASAFV